MSAIQVPGRQCFSLCRPTMPAQPPAAVLGVLACPPNHPLQGMCINARADPNATHVPFRDSKLTRLLQVGWGCVGQLAPLCSCGTGDCSGRGLELACARSLCLLLPVVTNLFALPPTQDSLGGNAKTSLLVAACDAAEHVEETLQSLSFGQRAMCVRIQVRPGRRRWCCCTGCCCSGSCGGCQALC